MLNLFLIGNIVSYDSPNVLNFSHDLNLNYAIRCKRHHEYFFHFKANVIINVVIIRDGSKTAEVVTVVLTIEYRVILIAYR